MKIQMICVGKIKETYLRELIDHYTKIIRKKYNFEIIELPDEKTPDNASDKEESKIKEIEGQRILDKIPEGSFVIPLCIKELLTPLNNFRRNGIIGTRSP